MRKKSVFVLAMTLAACMYMTACGKENSNSTADIAEISTQEVVQGEQENIEDTSENNSDSEVVGKESNLNASDLNYVEGAKEDFQTHELDANTIAITKYLGDKEYLIIPDSINGLSVVSVEGFENNDSLKGIIIPDTVISIGDYAFNDCSSLEKVTLGENIESIGEFAFINCYALSSINLPDSITEIGKSAFNGNNLTQITLPKGLTEIATGTFCNGQWEEITIPCNVKIIGDQAFAGDRKMKKVYIEEGVEEIGPNAFDDNELLEEIHIPSSVTTISEKSIADRTDIITIYGAAGSAAEEHAEANYFKFVIE